jgi:adenine-specific DNA-methyltransferase
MMNETTDQPEKFDLSSLDVSAEKRAELLRLFPEARTEGDKINFDRLKLALGAIIDPSRERYGLMWPGKADCFKTIQAPSLGSLRPAPKESVNWETTNNLIIEGDNLEVLKLLQKAYLGKVKMVYIDPPYNTGSDFIYPDNYGETLQTYLEYTGQISGEGRRFGTNIDTDGRFHSKWLNMMFPRLYLARNLLKEDGVIFVSIDDTEVSNLRMLCDDVFGAENFIAQLVWEGAGKNDARQIGVSHEYVLLYARDRDALPHSWTLAKEGVGPVLAEVVRLREKHGENFDAASEDLAGWFRANKAKPYFAHRRFRHIDQRGAYKEDDPTAPGGRKFDLKHPRTGETIPLRANRGWAFDQDTFDKMTEEGRITFVTPRSIMVRRYLHETDSVTPQSVFYQPARSASERLGRLLGEAVFDFPKDELILKQFVEMATAPNENDIVLDFFAGSGSTAHAVMTLNSFDGGNRRFILVQLPEPIEHRKFSTIADITRERVRLSAPAVRGWSPDELPIEESKSSDHGFRAFTLDESSFASWNGAEAADLAKLSDQLSMHIDHIRSGRTDSDILFELLLKAGFPLTVPIEEISLAGKQVYSIGGGVFLICLDRAISLEVIRAMAELKPSRVVCLDAGFAGNDQLKVNAVQTFRTKGVVKFQTV